MSLALRKALQAIVTFSLLLLLTAPSFAQRSLRRALDYDGDNKADFTVFRQTNAVWYILRSNLGFTATQFGVAVTDEPCPGDYDGDGKGDVCVWRGTNGTFYYLRSTTGTLGAQQFGADGDEPVARNWDGDGGVTGNGTTDFAVIRRSNNQMTWYVLTNAPTPVYSAFQFGLANDNAIPGDYDGDAKFDYAVQRPSSTGPNAPANIYIQQSTAGFTQRQFSLGSDNILPGDYDGDNKTDLCAVRDVGGQLAWFILNSSNGAFTSTQFGVSSTDFFVQNDYDGDGKTDIAVWRDTNGTFYYQGSMGGFQSAQFGQSSVDFPIAAYDTH